MFSLIVSIIAVVLTAGIAVATIYYGGTNINSSGSRAVAEQLVNAGEHLTSAGALYQNDHSSNLPASPVALAPDYLSAIPLPPQSVYAASAGTASINDWQYLQGTANIILPKLSLAACNAVDKLYGLPGIPATLDSKYLIQCYGVKEPYTFFFDPPGGNMKQAAQVAADTGPCIATGPSVFNFTGADQTATPPAGCHQATVKLWAAGGGGYSNTGGGGGFTTVTFPVASTDKLTLIVGQGGVLGTFCMFATCPADLNYHGGWGGGRSEVQLNGATVGIAGGGGGAGGRGQNSIGGAGGAGGGAVGANGGATYNAGGTGGTQTSGGLLATSPQGNGSLGLGGDSYGSSWNYGGGGNAYVGWNGNGGASGGGGGLYGGGSGADGQSYSGGAGAGGGSGYVKSGLTGTLAAGNGANPAGTSDANYPGGNVGVGGSSSNGGTGGNGYAVILWQ